MNTGVVILAAGESVRMGEPKQLLNFRGRTLLHRAMDTALSLPGAPVVVVLGAQAAQIRPHLDGLPVIAVENPGWREGMGSSLRTGLRALLNTHEEISSAIFLLCDQPLLSSSLLSVLVAQYEQGDHLIVASEYGGALGVPALFGRQLFAELLALKGDRGARQIIRARNDRTLAVPFPDGAFDVDTPADYARLRVSFGELPTRSPA